MIGFLDNIYTPAYMNLGYGQIGLEELLRKIEEEKKRKMMRGGPIQRYSGPPRG